jgi:hypothetical protein
LAAFCFGSGSSFAQSDSLPITVTLKVDSAYVIRYSKHAFLIADQIRENNYVVKSDSIKKHFFDISVTIKNTSDKTINIWLMKCSWTDNFMVNNNYIYLYGVECSANFPKLVKFDPGESRTYRNTLIKSIKFDYPCANCIYGAQVETTKLGLIIVDDIFNPALRMMDYSLAMADRSSWKMVWSNSLYLLTENEARPEPAQIPLFNNRGK